MCGPHSLNDVAGQSAPEVITRRNPCHITHHHQIPNLKWKTLIPNLIIILTTPPFRIHVWNSQPHLHFWSRLIPQPKTSYTNQPQTPYKLAMSMRRGKEASSSMNHPKNMGYLKSCSMSSASSTNNYKRNPGPRIKRQNREDDYEGPKRFCHCGLLAPRWTSWTNWNPGRRFFGCRYYDQVSLGVVVDAFGYECT